MRSSILILLVLLLTTCTEKRADNYSVIFRLQQYVPTKIDNKYDFSLYRSAFDSITDDYKNIIERLLLFEGDTSTGIPDIGRIGIDDPRVSFFNTIRIPSNEVAALHLICAIYYDDYYFSSDRILYNDSIVEFDSCYQVYVQKSSNNYSREDMLTNSIVRYILIKSNHYSSPESIKVAWKFVNDWWRTNSTKSLEEIRRQQRPLEGSNIYWYGEHGGRINSFYPMKFNVDYNRVKNINCSTPIWVKRK